jgi:O-methyltransferase involved in polyketide biosynthesis
MEKEKFELGNIQKTLLFPLWGRAIESKKEKPLFVDNTAIRIIQDIDYDFSKFSKELSYISKLGWVVRSLLIDKIITQFIAKHPKATIVDIGCGLDTTFERIDNGLIRWYDLDMPEIIELRKKYFKESERRQFISSSFLDLEWLNNLIIDDNLLFISAGVFYFFAEKEIKLFIQRIASLFPDCEVAFDASSPFGIKMANRMVIKKGGMDEKSFLKWGIKNAKEIELWDKKVSVVSEEAFFKKIRKAENFKNRIQLYFSDLTKIQYMIHLKINNE